MDQGHVRRIFQAVEKSLAGSGNGLKVLHIVSGSECFPRDEWALQLVDDCRALGLDVLFTEAADRRLLVAGQVYDDVYAVSLLTPNMPAVAAARYLQRLLSAESILGPEERLLPASDLDALLKRWEWQVSLIFGQSFAARLIEKAFAGQNCGRMTPEGLEQVRRYLISATGGSVDFTEST